MASSNASPTSAAMNVAVSGRHMAVGEALRSRISEELVAGVGKYFERGGSAEVTVHKDGHSVCVDVVVLLATGQQLVVSGRGGDAHAAFDAALTRLETRIRRYKRRLVNHHGNGATKGAPEMASLVVLRAPDDEAEFDEEWDGDGAGADGAPSAMIIAEAQAAVKTQTVSMAVMELDLSGRAPRAVQERRPWRPVGGLPPQRRQHRLDRSGAYAGRRHRGRRARADVICARARTSL